MYQELLQNAEDAGATEVKFVYDHHSYGRRQLHHPDMAAFQVCIHYITSEYCSTGMVLLLQ